MATATAFSDADPAASIPDNIAAMSDLEKQIYFACRNGRTVQSVTSEEDKQQLAVFMQWYDSRITAKKARDVLFPWMGWQYSRNFDVLFKENATLKMVLKYWSEWKKAYQAFIGTKSEPQKLQGFGYVAYYLNKVGFILLLNWTS
jgi:hypothetical protein